MLSRRHSRGMSLVELMVAITIALFIALGLSTFLSDTLTQNAATVRASRLNQELRALMMVMQRDIKRAGFWGSPTLNAGALTGVGIGSGYVNPFADVTTSGTNCILFSYDRNGNGTLDTSGPDERYGFRLNNGVVFMRSGVGATTFDCSGAGTNSWSVLTDSRNTFITELSFSVTTSAPAYVSGSSGPNMKVRQVTITLAGRSASDSAITQTLRDTVRLENDLFSPS